MLTRRRLSVLFLIGLLNIQWVSAQVLTYQGQLSSLTDAGNRVTYYTYS